MNPSDTSAYKELYLSTARQYIKALETHLPSIQGIRPDREQMDAVLIPAHSLKSQGYVMGYILTGKLAAVLEKKLLSLKNNEALRFDADTIDIMLKATRKINESLTSIEKTSAELDLTAEIAHCEQTLEVKVTPIP